MDYYLEDKSRLNGQPKRTVADYVESNGILVPRRFDSLREARVSHKGIFLRSEHVQEYDGISGLLDSFSLSRFRGIKNIDEAKERYFSAKHGSRDGPGWNFDYYCEVWGLSREDFAKEATFSIWEKLGGYNRTVVADSVVEGRHHVMTKMREGRSNLFNYTILQDGKIEKEFIKPLTTELREGLPGLIEIYEKIKNLDNFDSKNCPILEFQTFKEKDYFLQYHRTRDFSPVGFALDRALKKGEIEVDFVRGATDKEGMECKTTVFYHNNHNPSIQGEDGSFDFHPNWGFSDSQFPKRKLQFLDNQGETLDRELMGFVVNHTNSSRMFKPQVSVIANAENFLLENEIFYDSENGEFDFFEESKKGKNSFMNLHVVSDGRRCIMKRI